MELLFSEARIQSDEIYKIGGSNDVRVGLINKFFEISRIFGILARDRGMSPNMIALLRGKRDDAEGRSLYEKVRLTMDIWPVTGASDAVYVKCLIGNCNKSWLLFETASTSYRNSITKYDGEIHAEKVLSKVYEMLAMGSEMLATAVEIRRKFANLTTESTPSSSGERIVDRIRIKEACDDASYLFLESVRHSNNVLKLLERSQTVQMSQEEFNELVVSTFNKTETLEAKAAKLKLRSQAIGSDGIVVVTDLNG
jgi:hypothetical protein